MPEKEMAEGNDELDVHITKTITDEVLRYRIRKLLDEPKPASRWKRFFGSQLFSVAFSLIIGFLLTGAVGTYLTHYYSEKQAQLEHQRTVDLNELEHERSFADELNKVRVSKIAEVYEKFYVYEAAVEEVMKGVKVKSDSPLQGDVLVAPEKDLKKTLEESQGPRKELLAVLNKNRAWLEDDNYRRIKEYAADSIYEHYFALQTGQELQKWEEKREQAMVSLKEMREKMLKK